MHAAQLRTIVGSHKNSWWNHCDTHWWLWNKLFTAWHRIMWWGIWRLMRVQGRMVTTHFTLSFGFNLSDLLIPRQKLNYRHVLVSQLNPGMHCLQHPAFYLKRNRIIIRFQLQRRLINDLHHKRCVSWPQNKQMAFTAVLKRLQTL